jgi:hypothetical protein
LAADGDAERAAAAHARAVRPHAGLSATSRRAARSPGARRGPRPRRLGRPASR